MMQTALLDRPRRTPAPRPRQPAGDLLSTYRAQVCRFPVADPEVIDEQGRHLAETRRRLQEAILRKPALDEGQIARIAADYETARQDLVRSHLRLVLRLVRPYANRAVSPVDLVQEGNLGLIRAADLFDPRRGVRFSTYARWWVRNYVLNALACHAGPVKVPVRTLIHLSRLRRASSSLSHRFCRPATIEEMARASRVTLLDARRAFRHGRPVLSLDAASAPGADTSIADRTADLGSGETIWSDNQEKLEERIRGAIGSLTERERRVLELRFGLAEDRPRSRRETAAVLRLSVERIRQLELSALQRLRDPERWGVPIESLL